MTKNTELHPNLHYLFKKPKILNWEIVSGPPNYKLSSIQQYDLIYDKRDLKWQREKNQIN